MKKLQISVYGILLILGACRGLNVQTSQSGDSSGSGSSSSGSQAPVYANLNFNFPDPLQAGSATPDQVRAYDNGQAGVFGDFTMDANGFGKWTRLNSVVDTTLLCRNGVLELVRECNNPGNPAACLGEIRKIASCAGNGAEKERFSAWGSWVPSGSCVNNLQNFTRTCFALDGQAPTCYGPLSRQMACNAEVRNRFTKTEDCGPPPAGYQFNQFYIGCGNTKIYYNGQRKNWDGCFVDSSGKVNCSEAIVTTEMCVRPNTTCSSSNEFAALPGTQFTDGNGWYCGIPVLPSEITASNRVTAWKSTPVNEIAGSNLCGVGNRIGQIRECIPNSQISDCIMNIDHVVAGLQNDTSCVGQSTRQIASCVYGQTELAYRKAGAWGPWNAASGCSYIPSLGRFARLENRRCDSPAPQPTGAYCSGERTRYVNCAGSLDGNQGLVVLSTALSGNASILAKVNQYVSVLQAKGAEVKLEIQDSAQSPAVLRSYVDAYVLPSGAKPNVVTLIGGFKHAQVNGKDASGVQAKYYSDLPYEAPLDRFTLGSDGSFTLYEGYANTKMTLQRALYWIDFSNHNAVTAQYPDVSSKYLAFLTKMVAKQQAVGNQNTLLTQNLRPKMNLFVDGFWDNQPYSVSGNKVDLTSYVGTARSGIGGLKELLAIPADMTAIMTHSSGALVSIGGRTYLPSNDSLGSELPATGAVSFLGGIAIRASHLNLYACHSGDPAVPNNVMTSSVLNPDSTVVSVMASTTSGALDSWSGYLYYDALSLGHSAAMSYLSWSQPQEFGSNAMIKSPYGVGIYISGYPWALGLIKFGDAYYRP
jgi:hypothetical protein